METIMSFEQKQIDRKCRVFGELFKRSAILGYDSQLFIEQIMTTPEYNDLIQLDEGQEWCDECFLMKCFEDIKPFKKGNKYLDEFTLWFMGYLYKYWMITKHKSPQEVYKVLNFRNFLLSFSFYHTQNWDYIINDATNSTKNNTWDTELTINDLAPIMFSHKKPSNVLV